MGAPSGWPRCYSNPSSSPSPAGDSPRPPRSATAFISAPEQEIDCASLPYAAAASPHDPTTQPPTHPRAYQSSVSVKRRTAC
jgi:hypothetical protein